MRCRNLEFYTKALNLPVLLKPTIPRSHSKFQTHSKTLFVGTTVYQFSNMSSSFLDNYPASTPPEGVAPNFIDPPSRATGIEILDGVFCGLMLITVAIRCYVRGRLTKQWGWEDCKSFCRGHLRGKLIANTRLDACGLATVRDVPSCFSRTKFR